MAGSKVLGPKLFGAKLLWPYIPICLGDGYYDLFKKFYLIA